MDVLKGLFDRGGLQTNVKNVRYGVITLLHDRRALGCSVGEKDGGCGAIILGTAMEMGPLSRVCRRVGVGIYVITPPGSVWEWVA